MRAGPFRLTLWFQRVWCAHDSRVLTSTALSTVLPILQCWVRPGRPRPNRRRRATPIGKRNPLASIPQCLCKPSGAGFALSARRRLRFHEPRRGDLLRPTSNSVAASRRQRHCGASLGGSRRWQHSGASHQARGCHSRIVRQSRQLVQRRYRRPDTILSQLPFTLRYVMTGSFQVYWNCLLNGIPLVTWAHHREPAGIGSGGLLLAAM